MRGKVIVSRVKSILYTIKLFIYFSILGKRTAPDNRLENSYIPHET